MKLCRTVISIIVLFQVNYLSAQSSTSGSTQFRIQQIEKAIETEMAANRDPGLSVSIFHQGKPLLNKGYGETHAGKGDKVTSSTLFRNASTSKVLVAFAMLRLEQQRLVNLSNPLEQYLEQVHPALSGMSLNQLLSHTAGLKDETNDFGPGGVTRHMDYVKKLNENFLFAQPGEVFSYSNSGYNILGAVIEKVTKKKFNEAMKTLVFDYLDMPLSTYRLEEAQANHLALGHSGGQNNFRVNQRMPDNALERASGLMFTTANELNQLLIWLSGQSNDHSERELKKKLMTVLAYTDKTGSYWSYGYGLFHSRYNGQQSIWHSGGLPGYSATFLSVPDKALSIVVLTNGENINRWNIISAAVQTLIPDSAPAIQEPATLVSFSTEEQTALIGTYTQGVGPVIKITLKDGVLSMRVGNSTFGLQKNQKGQLVTITAEGPGIAYTPKYDEHGQVKFLQYWVRAYPKVN